MTNPNCKYYHVQMLYTAAIFAFTVLMKYARVDKRCRVEVSNFGFI